MTEISQQPKAEILIPDGEHKKGEAKSQLRALPYLSILFFPTFSLLSLYFGGYAPLFVGLMFYVIVSLLELLVGVDGYNPGKEESKYLESQVSFRLITWLWVPVQIILATAGPLYCSAHWDEMSWLEVAGVLIVVASNTGGVGITVAHELIHKQNWFEQTLGRVILHMVSYTHFFIEHIQGHHKRVATDDDPASSRLGDNVYWFIPKSAFGGYASAWDIEAKRLAKAQISFWSIRDNQMLHYTAATLATCAFFYAVAGPVAVLVFLLQSALSFTLLEIINYIEHYGLQRKELGSKGSKVYERVSPIHSWNADHRISNFVLFKLQRHADHHTWPTRRYQTLRSWDFSPQLPTGYVGMMLIALIPPLYHSVMDPRVLKYNAIMHVENPDD